MGEVAHAMVIFSVVFVSGNGRPQASRATLFGVGDGDGDGVGASSTTHLKSSDQTIENSLGCS